MCFLLTADLRRGSIHTYFGLPRSPGLSHLLSSDATTCRYSAAGGGSSGAGCHYNWHDSAKPIRSVELASVRPSSTRMGATISILSLLTLHPCCPSPTPIGLCHKRLDIVIFVVRIEQTKTRSLVRSEEVLRRLKAPVIGVVVNDIHFPLSGVSPRLLRRLWLCREKSGKDRYSALPTSRLPTSFPAFCSSF